MVQGFPAFTLNTEIEEILNKISKLYDGLRPPEVCKPSYRDKKGFLRFPTFEGRKAFLDKLHCEPPTGMKVGDQTTVFTFKKSTSKEYRAKTKEIRWWSWAMRRQEVLGDRAKDRKVFDTDNSKLVVFLCNMPVAGWMDEHGHPIQGTLDRSKHTFKVDLESMKTHFAKLGMNIDVNKLFAEFQNAK